MTVMVIDILISNRSTIERDLSQELGRLVQFALRFGF